jgi:phosphoribosylaminoimidazole-succinocarboxamide synthase
MKRLTESVRNVRKSELFKRLEIVLRDHRGECALDNETALADAVADLMHIADKQRVDWAEVERRASNHHQAEVSGADDMEVTV